MPQATITNVFEPDGKKPGAVKFDDGVKASFWYASGGKPGPSRGAFVVGQSGTYTVTEKQNGEYVNVYLNTWTPNGGAPGSAPTGNRDRSIVIQCCIKAACDRYSGMQSPDEDVLKFATSLVKLYDKLAEGPKPKPVVEAHADEEDPFE